VAAANAAASSAAARILSLNRSGRGTQVL
jgi:hypothetical protein